LAQILDILDTVKWGTLVVRTYKTLTGACIPCAIAKCKAQVQRKLLASIQNVNRRLSTLLRSTQKVVQKCARLKIKDLQTVRTCHKS
jgi:hypothetical protein